MGSRFALLQKLCHGHHILFRSRGATDNPKYLASVCDTCHTAEAHKPGEILYEWMEQEKQFARGLRDATFMNILRRRLFQAFPEATFTYGNITAETKLLVETIRVCLGRKSWFSCEDFVTKNEGKRLYETFEKNMPKEKTYNFHLYPTDISQITYKGKVVYRKDTDDRDTNSDAE